MIKKALAAIMTRIDVLMGAETIVEHKAHKLEDGTEIEVDGEDLAEGTAVYKLNEQGERTPLEDGEYTMESGDKVYVKDGKLSTKPEEAPEEEAPVESEQAEEAPTEQEAPKEDEAPADDAKMKDMEDRIATLEEGLMKAFSLLESMQTMSKEKHSAQPKPGAPAIKAPKVDKTEAKQGNSAMEDIRSMMKAKAFKN